MQFYQLSDEDIIHLSLSHVGNVVFYIDEQARKKIGIDVKHITGKAADNITREIDIWTHNYYKLVHSQDFGDRVKITGEEEVKDEVPIGAKCEVEQIHTKEKILEDIVASIDAVDGTDLVYRGFYNWCTALFFYVPNKRIIASFVGIPSGISNPFGFVYYSFQGATYKTWLVKDPEKTLRWTSSEITIPEDIKKKQLKDVSICFYGQKAGNLLGWLQADSFKNLLRTIDIETQKKKAIGERDVPTFRIYNFGGNPMMVKLAESKVDAVIELKGQKVYDCIPGAQIAVNAGAFWGDLEGNEINETYLLKAIAEDKRLSYILASSKSLYDNLLENLKD